LTILAGDPNKVSIHVALNHVMHYRYDRLVTLGPQIIRLRPAPHCRTSMAKRHESSRQTESTELPVPAATTPRKPRKPTVKANIPNVSPWRVLS
jgi:hypothetical protein